MTIGREIERKIIRILDKSDNPVSTRDLALRIGRAWHSVQHHCFRLQIAGRINGFQVGRMNLWQMKKEPKKGPKEEEASDEKADEKKFEEY